MTLRNSESSYGNMRPRILIKATGLRSVNQAAARMDIEFIAQLRRLMLYPTELRAVRVFAVVLTNNLRSAPHCQNARSYYRREYAAAIPKFLRSE